MWRLMLVACMMIASRQNATEMLSALPAYDVVSLNTGYSADSIVNTEQNVHLVLGNDATAVSALRVCQVLLERLGGQHQEPRQSGMLSEDLQSMVYKVSCSSSLFKVQPSMVAQALVYCLRKKRGLVPLWPAALVQLTGIYDPTVGDLGLVLQQLLPLLGLDAGAAPPAAGSAASGPPASTTAATPVAATPAAATTAAPAAASGAAAEAGAPVISSSSKPAAAAASMSDNSSATATPPAVSAPSEPAVSSAR